MADLTETKTINHLISLDQKLEEATEQHSVAVKELYDAKVGYKLAYARAVRSVSGTAQQREADALLACEVEYREFMVAEARVEGLVQVVRSLRERCNNGRSLNASVRGQANEGAF